MRYHATPDGTVPFTPEEEAEWDAREAEYAAGADDRAAAKVRKERNAKLAATDFHGLTDTVMNAEMTTYRQALRDVSEQEGFPNTIVWPTEPS